MKRRPREIGRQWPQPGPGLALLLAVALACPGCSSGNGERPPAATDAFTVAVTREPLGALMVIASEKGYFAQQGIDVAIVDKYPSGKRALEGLLDGEVDVAPAAETPIVFSSFERNDFAIVATIGSSDDEPAIVARRDRGIEKPDDLRGKRIGTQRGSAVHYFLHLFLLRHAVPADEVELSYWRAEELPSALADGRIDAFSLREPFASEATRLMDGPVTVFREPGLYVKTFNLVFPKRVIDEKPEAVRRLLEALARAERFADENPDPAIGMVATRLNVDRATLADAWNGMDLRLSLGQQLLVALEDEARWAIGSGLVPAHQPPNYLDFLYLDALQAVRPAAVTVIQ